MDREPLEILAALAETGSLRQAAKKLHKSQPALSAQIRKLEEELGFDLLDRRTYRARLSERGQAFLERSGPVLAGFRGLEELARSLALGFEPRLGLAVSALYPIERLLGRIEAFGALFPQTELRLWVELLGGTWERLLEGEADLAIAAKRPDAPGPAAARIEQEPLTRIALVPVCGAASRLARGGVIEADLMGEPQILVTDTAQHQPRRDLDRLEGAPHWQVGSYEIMKRILLDGTGWGCLPAHLIGPELKRGELVSFEAGRFRQREVELVLVRQAGRVEGAAGLTLWQLLLQDRET